MAERSPCLDMLTGKPIPQVGLGTFTWSPDKEEIKEAVKDAIDAGYRHIDTARGYLNESHIGEALDELIQAGKLTRDEIFITAKLSGGCAIPRNVKPQTEISLKLLKTDYIDLLLIHFPVAFSDVRLYDDPPNFYPSDEEGNSLVSDTKPLETYREMEKLVDEGLVKAIGLSNFNKEQIQTIWDNARIKPSNLQCECHAWLPQNDLVDFCKEKGITFSAYAPIGSPEIIGSGLTDYTEILMKEPVVLQLAEKLNRTPAQILLKSLVQRGIIVIPRSVKKERIISNFQLFDFTLSEDDMEMIKGLRSGKRLFTFKFFKKLENHPEFPFELTES